MHANGSKTRKFRSNEQKKKRGICGKRRNIRKGRLIPVETAGIDIRLKPPKAKEKYYAIAGSVVAADSGAPIPGAKVRIRFRLDGGVGWGTEVRTGNKGEFRFDRAIPGSFQIFSIGDEKKYGLSQVVEIEITDADVEGIELKTEIGARLSGEVVYVGTTSRKLEELFSRAGFWLYGLSEPTRVPVRRITIDRQGKFSMSGVAPGKYWVGFQSNGETGWMLLGIENGEQGNSPEFTIGPGETIENFRLLIDRGTGVIHGRIQFTGELPTNAGAQVMAWREGLKSKYGVTIDNIDSQGFFRLEGLLPGRYTVVCEIQFSSSPVPDSWKFPQPQNVTVDVVEGQAVNLDLKFDIRPR